MSRGFGQIERAIIRLVDHNLSAIGATGPELAQWIAGTADSPSVRRALKRLEAKGVIAPLPERYGRSIIWILTKTAKDEAKQKRRREWAGARRAEEKRQARQESEDARMDSQRRRDRAHDTARLENLLGMLGSAHAGERANAARAAEKERRRLGKTWGEILRSGRGIEFGFESS